MFKIFEKYKNSKLLSIELSINIICLFFIGMAVYTSFSMLLTDRSLWLDEAMLAYSFSIRSFWTLTSDKFDWVQSAPVLYLYIVKIITLIFGTSEISLRVWSFICYLGVLVSVYYIMKNLLEIKLPLFAVLFTAISAFILDYSVEFKPYISDALTVLLSLIFYFLYTKKRISIISLTIIYMLMIWSSNPSCFFIGACLLYEFVETIYTKNYRQTKNIIICGICVLVSFVIYYFYWLKPVIDAGEMSRIWSSRAFPILPTSKADINTAIVIVKDLLLVLGTNNIIIMLVCITGFFINLFFIKNKLITLIYIGLLITFIASSLGMFPIQDRMVLFIYPLLTILFFFYIGQLYNAGSASKILIFATVAFIFTGTIRFSSFLLADKDYHRQSFETNFPINYIREHIKENEKIYIETASVPGFLFKNNYDSLSFAGYKDNVLLGTHIYVEPDYNLDLQKIKDNSPCYIVISHTRIENIGSAFPKILMDSLNVQIVYEKYDTSAFYYDGKR